MKKGLALFAALVFIATAPLANALAHWDTVPLKYSPDGNLYTYCPGDQCLYNISGTTNDCRNNMQFVGDYYCDSGSWTTRTRLVASKLLEFVLDPNSAYKTSFSLICGNLTETGINEKLPAGTIPANFEKFCVLKYGSNFGFGAVLKTATTPQTALSPYINSCPTSTSGAFNECTGLKSGVTGKFYYNSNINSIIYLQPGSLAAASIIPPTTTFLNIIQTPFTTLRSFLFEKRPIYEDELQKNLLTNTKLFDKLYMAKTGSKSFFAVLQQGQYPAPGGTAHDYIIINYTGISGVPLCDAESLVEKKGVFCDTTNGIHTVSSCTGGGAVESCPNLYTYWLDLTSKLRPT